MFDMETLVRNKHYYSVSLFSPMGGVMQRFSKQAAMIILFTLAVSIFTGCGGSKNDNIKTPGPAPQPPPTSNVVNISTVAQLNDIRNDPGASYRLTTNISLFSSTDWKPIGSIQTPFTGKFDGNGYAITGLTIEAGRTEQYAGLFGFVDGGVISNVTLESVVINGRIFAGGIAGYMKNGAISNSYSAGNVYGDTAGGLVGRTDGGSIMGSGSTGFVEGGWDAGGIVGYADNSLIENCLSTGHVYADIRGAGGVVGYSVGGRIINCGSEGDINGYDAGGIAGTMMGGLITFSDSVGYIYGEMDAGGIAGIVYDGSEITESFSTGDIYALEGGAGGIAGVIYYSLIEYCSGEGFVDGYIAGGIAGYAESSVIYYCDGIGDVYSESDAGGIAGTTVDGVIESCYNEGYIDGYNAGGIAGTLDNSTIMDCNNTGNVYAVWDAGGIAGAAYGDIVITDSFMTRGVVYSEAGRAGNIVGWAY